VLIFNEMLIGSALY